MVVTPKGRGRRTNHKGWWGREKNQEWTWTSYMGWGWGKGPEPDKEKLQGLRGNRTRNGQGKGLKLQKVGGEKEH